MARKRLNGVWRSSTEGQVWYTGLSFDDFAAKVQELFESNWRMVDIDTNGGYSAVWHPGSDGQVWYVGLSWDEFVRHDHECLEQGMRLVALEVDDGRHAAVWRTGSGRQEVLATSHVNDLLAADNQHFAEGLRTVALTQDFDRRRFYGVWRSDLGDGAQWCQTGMKTIAEFQAMDAQQTAAGLRLTRISSVNGITGIWRSGNDGEWWALLEPFDEFAALVTRNADSGLRLVCLNVGYV